MTVAAATSVVSVDNVVGVVVAAAFVVVVGVAVGLGVVVEIVPANIAAVVPVFIVAADAFVDDSVFCILSHVPVCGSHPPVVVQSHVILHVCVPYKLTGQPKTQYILMLCYNLAMSTVGIFILGIHKIMFI